MIIGWQYLIEELQYAKIISANTAVFIPNSKGKMYFYSMHNYKN